MDARRGHPQREQSRSRATGSGLRRRDASQLTLGDYEVLADVESTPQVTTHLAFHRDRPRPTDAKDLVLLEHYHLQLVDADTSWDDFRTEFNRLQRLTHPNIVRLLACGGAEGSPYQVYEHLRGASLQGVIELLDQHDRMLPIATATTLCIDVLQGLHAAHEARDESGQSLGLVHRDLRPSNVWLDDGGTARVRGFSAVRHQRELTTSRVEGTKGYLAPELVNSPKSVDRRADLWSVAVMLWELLAGQRLFAGKTDAATLASLLADPIPPLERVNPDVPAVLSQAVARALSRSRELRPQTCEDFADTLEDALEEADLEPNRQELARLAEAAAAPLELTPPRSSGRHDVPSESGLTTRQPREEPLSSKTRLSAPPPPTSSPASVTKPFELTRMRSEPPAPLPRPSEPPKPRPSSPAPAASAAAADPTPSSDSVAPPAAPAPSVAPPATSIAPPAPTSNRLPLILGAALLATLGVLVGLLLGRGEPTSTDQTGTADTLASPKAANTAQQQATEPKPTPSGDDDTVSVDELPVVPQYQRRSAPSRPANSRPAKGSSAADPAAPASEPKAPAKAPDIANPYK